MQNKETSKAWKIGSTCVITYIASYYMRNLLGVLTPQMLETGNFTKEWLGLLNIVVCNYGSWIYGSRF